MILSDRSIREALAAGEIEIDPLDETCIQPSSVDLHLDRYFRVFLNHTMRVIDVKEDQEELTQLVEVKEDDPFVLHPGEFVLGSTLERVKLPNDLVARLEGKSSLGRLGLLIHSSLPADEPVLFLHEGTLEPRPIGDIVAKRLEGSVVSFDPDTFEVDYHPVTGWYEGPADRIYEIRLASGRRVRVTGGHNLFTLDRDGGLEKVRTMQLTIGARVAIPGTIPDPVSAAPPVIDVRRLVPESQYDRFVLTGPSVAAALEDDRCVGLLRGAGFKHVNYYRARMSIPMAVGRQVPGLIDALGEEDVVRGRGARRGLPAVIPVDAEVAWLLGIFIAEGYRRRGQVVISNTDGAILDRAAVALAKLGQPVYRRDGVAVTCTSSVLSDLLGWIGTGGKAPTKRVPPLVFGWPQPLLTAFFQGMCDGDGSYGTQRDSYWTSSPGLASDVMMLATRLGRRAATCFRSRKGTVGLYQVMMPHREHKLLTSVPLPDLLLRHVRHELGLSQAAAGALAEFRHPTDLNNIERRTGRTAVRRRTLRRLRDAYRNAGVAASSPALDRLVDGGLAWDEVVEVVDSGAVEPIYDLEVRPDGRHIENFVAGAGGVFVSNTAGFVDAGWNGQLTLELSNVANLPITLYPGMKIGQISFLRMTTPADVPYGSTAVGSKYQHQVGPRPSRYFENFRDT